MRATRATYCNPTHILGLYRDLYRKIKILSGDPGDRLIPAERNTSRKPNQQEIELLSLLGQVLEACIACEPRPLN